MSLTVPCFSRAPEHTHTVRWRDGDELHRYTAQHTDVSLWNRLAVAMLTDDADPHLDGRALPAHRDFHPLQWLQMQAARGNAEAQAMLAPIVARWTTW